MQTKVELRDKGFIEVSKKYIKGYFSINGKIEYTNFIIRPKYRNTLESNMKYWLEIVSGNKSKTIWVSRNEFINRKRFQEIIIIEAGAFMIYCSVEKWMQIVKSFEATFKDCRLLTKYGWNYDFNFFLYEDIVWTNEGLISIDEKGMFSSHGVLFLCPNNITNIFKPEPHNKYKKSPVKFSVWANQMQLVYSEKGLVAISYIVMTIFNDIITNTNGITPILNVFGNHATGKSAFINSIMALFYNNKPSFGLSSGTDFAFHNQFEKYDNCPLHFDELDNYKSNWIIYLIDHYYKNTPERGLKYKKIAEQNHKSFNETIICSSQSFNEDINYECIIERFYTEEKGEKQTKEYHLLKSWERQGINSLLEDIFSIRETFKDHYDFIYNIKFDKFNSFLIKKKIFIHSRNQLSNYIHLAACYYAIVTCFIDADKEIDFTNNRYDFDMYCINLFLKYNEVAKLPF